MRQEIWQLIEPALERVRRQHEVFAQRFSTPGALHATNQVSLLPETEQGLQQMYAYMQSLEACMAAHPGVRSVYSASSISIYWSTSLTSDDFVVEFSQWAPVVAVYSYGSPPDAVSQRFNHCLAQLPVILLTDEEIDELYERQIYLMLF